MDRIAGVRELKARLSHYLDVAREDGAVIITDRGKPVARLTAMFEKPSRATLEDVLDALAAEGALERGARPLNKRQRSPVSTSRRVSGANIVRQMRR
jgi:prevent-host-death family protein